MCVGLRGFAPTGTYGNNGGMKAKVRQYKSRWELPRHYRRALRAYAHGATLTAAAALAPTSPDTLGKVARTPGGAAYLAHHRDLVDAHRVLLAATLPYLDLSRALQAGIKPKPRPAAKLEEEG